MSSYKIDQQNVQLVVQHIREIEFHLTVTGDVHFPGLLLDSFAGRNSEALVKFLCTESSLSTRRVEREPLLCLKVDAIVSKCGSSRFLSKMSQVRPEWLPGVVGALLACGYDVKDPKEILETISSMSGGRGAAP